MIDDTVTHGINRRKIMPASCITLSSSSRVDDTYKTTTKHFSAWTVRRYSCKPQVMPHSTKPDNNVGPMSAQQTNRNEAGHFQAGRCVSVQLVPRGSKKKPESRAPSSQFGLSVSAKASKVPFFTFLSFKLDRGHPVKLELGSPLSESDFD